MTKLVGFVLLIVATTIINGFVLSTLWGWFIVPTFGLSELRIVQAVGVGLVAQVFTGGFRRSSTDSDKDPQTAIVVMLLTPLVVLMIGWAVHLFFM